MKFKQNKKVPHLLVIAFCIKEDLYVAIKSYLSAVARGDNRRVRWTRVDEDTMLNTDIKVAVLSFDCDVV